MKAVAINESSREKVNGFQEMGTLRCDVCGEDFFIGHNPVSVDKLAAERQAWLEEVLAEEHERRAKIFGKGDVFVPCTNPKCPNKVVGPCKRNPVKTVPAQARRMYWESRGESMIRGDPAGIVTPRQGNQKSGPLLRNRNGPHCALLWLEISPIVGHGKDCVCSKLDRHSRCCKDNTLRAAPNVHF